MEKSILVFDTPENCDECQLMQSYYDHGYGLIKECIGSGINDCIVLKRKLEDYCPLRPIPQKMEYKTDGYAIHNYEKGWNECIDEILGEKVKG